MNSEIESAYFKTVLESFPGSLAIVSGKGQILYMNNSWKRFYQSTSTCSGNNNDSIGANYFLSFLHGAGIEGFLAQKATLGINSVLNKSAPKFEFQYPCSDVNGPKWFMMIVNRIDDISDSYLVVHLDVTAYKNTEQRSQIFATLLDSESDGMKFLLQEPDGSYAILAMLEQSSEGLVLTDPDFRVIYANNSMNRLHGYQPGELIGKDLGILFDTDEIRFHQLTFPDLDGGLSFDGELFNRRKDGTTFPSITYKRALISAKEVSGYVWTIHDISRLKQSEDELNRRAEELEAKIRQLNCVYQISELTQQPQITLAELLQGIVELIPEATRFPNKIGAMIQVGSEIFSAGPVDKKLWERSFEIKVEDKVLATLTICFAQYYQGDETFEMFDDELTLIKVVGEQLGRLIERYGLVAELEQHAVDQYRDLSKLELISGPRLTPVSTQAYGLGPLSESQPEEFQVLLRSYEEALDLVMDQKTYKVDHNISELLRDLASRIGFLRGGPRDVIELHSIAVRNKTRDVGKQRAKAYFAEGKFMAFGLLGHLASYYRNRAQFVANK